MLGRGVKTLGMSRPSRIHVTDRCPRVKGSIADPRAACRALALSLVLPLPGLRQTASPQRLGHPKSRGRDEAMLLML